MEMCVREPRGFCFSDSTSAYVVVLSHKKNLFNTV